MAVLDMAVWPEDVLMLFLTGVKSSSAMRGKGARERTDRQEAL